MKYSPMLWASVVAIAALTLTSEYTLAQPAVPVYAVCVGQYSNRCPSCNIAAGPHMKCTGYDAVYGCAYAANPLQQVKVFCNGKGTNPVTWRTISKNGNQCGYSVIGI